MGVQPLSDWLLFLGAGASAARPTCLPTFPTLAAGVLRSIGWHEQDTPSGLIWTHARYPPFRSPSMSAEVLFGALSWFGIDFAEELAKVLDGAPNAIHHFAGAVLDAGGTVWTTNVDRCVERGCGSTPQRAGGAAHLAPELF